MHITSLVSIFTCYIAIFIHRVPSGECPAVDFETKMYNESLDVLEHHIKPLRRVPGVVLEQSYLNKMADGLKPLEMLATSRSKCKCILYKNDDI